MPINFTTEMEKARREIRRLKSSLRAGELRAKMFSEYSSFGLWEYDIATDSFRQFKKPSGDYDSSIPPIANFRDTLISTGAVYAEDLAEFNRFCDAMRRGDRSVSCKVRTVGESGGIRRMRYEGKTVFDADGKPVRIVGRTVDITDDTAHGNDSSGRDALTGAYTPETLRDIVRQKRSGVNRYNSGALLSVGVDRLPDITAKCGHDYADYIQKSVCRILTELGSERRDSVIARVRDGEFLMYISCSSANTPDKTAKRIIDRVKAFDFDRKAATVSVGISRLRTGKTLDAVYGESSLAMLEARKSGGSCYMRYSPSMSAPDAPADSYVSASVGAARVYELILKAFCEPNNSAAFLKAAFRSLGAFSGASGIYFFRSDNGIFKRHMLFNASDIPKEKAPGVVQTCDNETLAELFGRDGRVRIHDASEEKRGLELTGGAVCAECRAIRAGGITSYFAVVFSDSFELSDELLQVIDALQSALQRMYHGREAQITRRFNSAIISDHRIEGFSIIPGSFIMDYVGRNAAKHYHTKPGDVCYKAMRGRDEPCAGCPALKLEPGNLFFASSAYYDEKAHRWIDITASVNENENGERRYYISTTDITDCLGNVRITDTLTGAMNFDTFAAESLKLTEKSSGGVYIAVMNVAGFRRVNETHGFESGNRVLVAAAEILMRCLGNGELVCRHEGSRFVALIREPNDAAVEKRLRLILNSIQQQIFDKFKIQIYLLAGVCSMNGEKEIGVMGALDRAITAQSTIHETVYFTENQVVFYDGALREAIRERLYIEENMFGALANGEFKVYYQPKVSIATGDIVGAEALVRWIRPNGDMISPGKFVPIFEQNGFITEMDFAIYKNAVTDIARWLRLEIEVPLISLNVSRFHLGDEHFCEKLDALVNSSGVPHEYIELEITESLLTEHLEKLVETVEWFKDRGYRISVDDFGSGYSSLNLITQLPFDTLKIDGGFFLRNDLSDKNKKVITSVVTLAKSLNLETVSEGVETQTQVDFLKELGCDMIQGFFYYKPMPGEDFEKLLLSRRDKISYNYEA